MLIKKAIFPAALAMALMLSVNAFAAAKQQVVFEVKGEEIKVVSFDDNTKQVFVSGKEIPGEAGQKKLVDAGIQLMVNHGEITVGTLGEDVEFKSPVEPVK